MAGQPKARAKREAAAFELGGTIIVENPIAPAHPKRSTPVETFGIQAADDVATMRACDTLFRWDGDVRGALVELGYDVKYAPVDKVAEVARIVFDEAVIASMHRRLANVEAQKNALMARQVEIAKHGEPEIATRAFQSIARVAGWIAPVKVDVSGRVTAVNIHTVMQNPEMLQEALDQLGYEPGAPIAASSEARERFEKRAQLTGETIEHDEAGDGTHG